MHCQIENNCAIIYKYHNTLLKGELFMQRRSNKIMAVLLSIALIFSCLVAYSVSAEDKTETESVTVWDGTADSELEGSGSDIDPFLITNAGELYYAVTTTKGYHFRLANDIIINDITVKIENGEGVVYNADGTTALDATALAVLNSWHDGDYSSDEASRTKFRGTLDGDGHIIRGLYLDSSAGGTATSDDFKYARALIPYAQSGTVIKNLGLEDAYISYEGGTASGFIGYNGGALLTAENCYVGASAYFYGYNASAFFGSGSQTDLKSSVKNCYSQATLKVMPDTTDTRWGTVFADSWNSKTAEGKATIENFYTTTKLTHSTSMLTQVANIYDYVSATEGYIGTAFDGNTFLPSDAFAAVEGELPTLKVFRNLDNDMWGGLGDSDLEGSGTSSDPYLISTGEELAYVMANNGKFETSGEYFELTNDIYLNNVFAENWKESADNNLWYSPADNDAFGKMLFVGKLDGNGYCIYGIWNPADSTAYASGLVPGASWASIKNLGIKESQIAATLYAGGLVGYCSGKPVTLSGCFTDSTVDVIQNDNTRNGGAGGLVGYVSNGSDSNYLNITNCYSLANCISAQSQSARANGILGTIWKGAHKVSNSYAFGNAPYYTSSGSLLSPLALAAGTVKYTDTEGNPLDAKPTADVNYIAVYTDYYDTYTWNASTGKYKSAVRTYTGYSKLTEAYSNVYGNVSKNSVADADGNKSYTYLTDEKMSGEKAVENMKLDGNIWYSVKDDGVAPMLRIHGTAIGDVNEDGVGLGKGDDEALRLDLIGSAAALNGDYNRDGEKDVTDLVAVSKGIEDNKSSNSCKHSYKRTEKVKATVTVDGINEYTCRYCGDTYTENIGNAVKILAIGNSFTVDGTEYLYDILTDAGIENVVLERLQIGGCSLDTHWTNISENNSKYSGTLYTKEGKLSTASSINYAISEYDWDFITIQQVSQDAGMPDSYGNLHNILEFLDQNKTNEDAKIFWQMTWAYQQTSGHSGFENYNKDQMTMYNAIVNTLKGTVLADDLIDGIIPSATTMQNMRTSHLGDTLTRDGFHASYDYGRYAIALTWMKALTGISPEAVDWVPADYAYVADNHDLICEAVNNAVEKPYEVTPSTYTEAPEVPEDPEDPVDPDTALMAANGLDITDFELLDWEPTVGAYYNSQSKIDMYTGDTTAPKYIASKLLYKADLPVGSVIILDSGYSYRPEGWITASTKNSTRPAKVTDNFTKVDETWWGNYTIRGFNLSSASSNIVMTESDASALRIYIPKS